MYDIDVIIASYLTGNASLEEMRFLKEWIAGDKANMVYFQKRREIWLASRGAWYDSEKAYSRFQRRVHDNASVRRRAFARYLSIGLAGAACLLVCVFLSFRKGVRSVCEPAVLAECSVSAPAGSTTSVTLSDGTVVTLNSDSHISYHRSFGMTERNITLSGEAFFDVRHDDALPFTVNVNGASIKDIGTKFNISAYDNNDFISVSVVEGSAEVHNLLGGGKEYAVLNASQTAEIIKGDGQMTVRVQSSISPSEWMNGAIVFENSTLLTIANELSRRYRVHVMIADEKLKSTRFYCCFVGDDCTLGDILKSLEATGKVRCEKNGSTIIFN